MITYLLHFIFVSLFSLNAMETDQNTTTKPITRFPPEDKKILFKAINAAENDTLKSALNRYYRGRNAIENVQKIRLSHAGVMALLDQQKGSYAIMVDCVSDCADVWLFTQHVSSNLTFHTHNSSLSEFIQSWEKPSLGIYGEWGSKSHNLRISDDKTQNISIKSQNCFKYASFYNCLAVEVNISEIKSLQVLRLHRMPNLLRLDISKNTSLVEVTTVDSRIQEIIVPTVRPASLTSMDLRGTQIPLERIVTLRQLGYPVISNFDAQFGPRNVGNLALRNQEALIQQRARVVKEYQDFATRDPKTRLLINRFLPKAEQADADFVKAFEVLQEKIIILALGVTDTTEAFRLSQADRGLSLLNGDPRMPRHGVSSVDSYKTFALQGLPSIRQLFVLLYYLYNHQANLETRAVKEEAERRAMEAQLGLVFGASSGSDKRFSAFTTYLADNNYKIAGTDLTFLNGCANIGEILQQDTNHVLVDMFVNINGEKSINLGEGGNSLHKMLEKIATQAQVEHTAEIKPSYDGLIDAMFMVQRGHNTAAVIDPITKKVLKDGKLLDPTEPNKPRCAEGVLISVIDAVADFLKITADYKPSVDNGPRTEIGGC